MRPLSVLAALCLFAHLSPLQAAPAIAAPSAQSQSGASKTPMPEETQQAVLSYLG